MNQPQLEAIINTAVLELQSVVYAFKEKQKEKACHSLEMAELHIQHIKRDLIEDGKGAGI
jgi:hypothetical protein